MANMESFINWGVFNEKEVGFMPIGPTNADVNHLFSTTSSLLCTNDAITVSYMHSERSMF